MTVKQIKEKLDSKEYNFLREDPHLGERIMLLGLGGSYAYGTNVETSDIDIRGIALNSKRELLTNEAFEQFVNEPTDTTIYAFNKIISLLANANPNTIEILGLEPWQYFKISPIGQELLDNKEMFLSRRCIHSFGGYAAQQLYRLNQVSTHRMGQEELEKHILKTLQLMQEDFTKTYTAVPEDGIKLYIDKSEREEMETEIFMDVRLSNYPVRDYLSMWNTLQTTVKQYNKVGKRNSRALEHGKIAKHMMHLCRLYLMCFDILEKEEIRTLRHEDHNFLMKIRNGEFITDDNQVRPVFYEIVDEYEKRLAYDKENTDLPANPDFNRINDFVMSVNERVVRGDI